MRDILIGAIGSLIATILVALAVFTHKQLGLRLARANPQAPALLFLGSAAILTIADLGSVLLWQWVGGNIWWFILPAFLTSIAVAIYWWRALGQFWHVGLRGADRSILTGVDYNSALRLCRNYIDFLGVGASKLTHEPEFVSAVLRCRQDVPIRFLLLSPSDDSLKAAAKRAGKAEGEYRDLVLSSLRILADLKARRNINLEVRFYKEEPILRLMFIDRSICLLSYNNFGEGDGSQLPQLHVAKSPEARREVESFYYPLELYFRRLWDSSEPWEDQGLL